MGVQRVPAISEIFYDVIPRYSFYLKVIGIWRLGRDVLGEIIHYLDNTSSGSGYDVLIVGEIARIIEWVARKGRPILPELDPVDRELFGIRELAVDNDQGPTMD
jgi:hypothetical protein